MNPDPRIAEDYRRVTRLNQRWGIIFGVVMGLAFAAGAWGMDALSLSQSSTDFPWLRLASGLALTLPVAFLAGWLTGWSDNGFLSAIIWSLAAAAILWIAGHVPYEISSLAIRWLDPNFQNLEVYPFPESAATRLMIGLAVGVVAGLIAGGLGAMAVDNMRLGVGFSRIGMVLVCGFLMVCAGLFSDNITNRPLRVPLVEMDNLIDLYLSYQGKTITSLESRQNRFGVLKTMTELVTQPRRLVLGDYQPDTLESARVYVLLGDTWFRCWVITDQPSFCQKSEEIYSGAFTCLWQDGEKCGAVPQAGVFSWIEQNNHGQAVSAKVFAQRGAYTLLAVDLGEQGAAECLFKDAGKLSLEACSASPRGGAVLASSVPLDQTAVPAAAEPVQAAGRQLAVLPEAWEAVEKLNNLPHYTLRVELAPDGLSFQGQMTLVYTNTEPVQLDELLLRLFPNGGKSYGDGKLDILPPVTVSGQEVQAAAEAADPSLFYLPLPGGLEPGASTRLSLVFRGVVPQDFGGDDNPDAYGLYNFTQNTLALSGWYPLLAVYGDQGWRTDGVSAIGDSVYSEMAFYDVTITAPANWVVAATGFQVSEEPAGSSMQHVFSTGPARDFFIAASPDFQRVSKTIAGTTVHSYSLPGSESGGEEALQVGARALEIFNRQFGRYPDTELDIVQAPMRNAGGVEFPGIVLIESSRYEDPQSNTFITTVAHEVAHQWWYNIVGNDIFTDPWLDEGLTTYSSFVYYEFALGDQAYQGILDFYQERYDKLVEDGNDDRITNSLGYFEKEHPERYGAVVYTKGALFFDAVRQEIGEQAFFAALRGYYQKEQYRVAAPGDLLGAFEHAAGRELDELFQRWLFVP
jgi:hypothetical protein